MEDTQVIKEHLGRSDVFALPPTIKTHQRPQTKSIYKTHEAPKSSYTLPYLKFPSRSSKLLEFSTSTPTSLDSSFKIFATPISFTVKNANQLNILKEIQEDSSHSNIFNSTIKSDSLHSKYISINSGALASVTTERKKNVCLRFNYDDSFVFNKIMKGQELTPFQKIISLSSESNTASFPYFMRMVCKVKKKPVIEEKGVFKNPKAYKECCCGSTNNRAFYKEVPLENDLRGMCEKLNRVIENPQRVAFENCFVLVCFEGVIGHFSDEKVKIRRGAIRFLKAIQDYFKIIILTKSPELIHTITTVLDLKEISFSAIYTIEPLKSTELIYINKIYKDFSIENPSDSLLVISSLNIEFSKGKALFHHSPRINKKLHINFCPVSTKKIPITYLVPHLLISSTPKPFELLFNSLNLKEKTAFSFQKWNKENRVKLKTIRSSLPFEILMERMPTKEVRKRCNLHQVTVTHCEEIPDNYFVVANV